MGKTPVLKFDAASLNECLLWWKRKLFLEDWVIHVRVVKLGEAPLDKGNMGLCDGDYVNRAAVIYIADYDSMDKNCSMTRCQEKILVHELLHCKYPSIGNNTLESRYLDLFQHSALESLAKTLMMVKYNIPVEWFDSDRCHTAFSE